MLVVLWFQICCHPQRTIRNLWPRSSVLHIVKEQKSDNEQSRLWPIEGLVLLNHATKITQLIEKLLHGGGMKQCRAIKFRNLGWKSFGTLALIHS